MTRSKVNRIRLGLPAIALALGVTAAAAGSGAWPVLRGPYLGQTPPGDEPELFAPGLVSTSWGDRDIAISPAGDEIWFGLLDRVAVSIRVSRLVDGVWTEPVFAAFARDPNYGFIEPALSPDGNRLYFLTTMPLPGEDELPGWGNQNIFYVERTADGWSDPRPAPEPISTLDNEYYPSFCSDGTLYYAAHKRGEPARIWRSRFVGGSFQEPEILPDRINRGENAANAFVSPDESFLIVCIGGHEENLGQTDYWISFRNERDEWSELVNLGPKVNGPETRAGSAYVSPDGKYLFFSATWSDPGEFFPGGKLTAAGLRRTHESPRNGGTDIYWMEADFLQELRPAGW